MQITTSNKVNSIKEVATALPLLRLCQGLPVISRKVKNVSASSPTFSFSQTQRSPPTGDYKLQWQTSKAGWQFQTVHLGVHCARKNISHFLSFLTHRNFLANFYPSFIVKLCPATQVAEAGGWQGKELLRLLSELKVRKSTLGRLHLKIYL